MTTKSQLKLNDLKIMVVEDDPQMAKVIKKILEHANINLASCDTGEAALEQIPEFQPDILILDIILPGISGIDVCKAIRKNDPDSSLPILYISAVKEDRLILNAIEAGGTDYIHKPFEPTEILTRVKLHSSIIRMKNQFQDQIRRLKKSQFRDKQKLEGKNSSIKEMVELLKEEKSRVEHQVVTNIDKILRPILSHLRNEGSQPSDKVFTLIENNLNELTSSFGSKISDKLVNLTQKEIEICNMLKNGMSSKEIANILKSSFRTIEKHRNNIRKKLGIIKKNVNLITYLNNLSTN